MIYFDFIQWSRPFNSFTKEIILLGFLRRLSKYDFLEFGEPCSNEELLDFTDELYASSILKLNLV